MTNNVACFNVFLLVVPSSLVDYLQYLKELSFKINNSQNIDQL